MIIRTIPLTGAKHAIVDDADFERLSQWKWYACRRRNNYYATRHMKLPNGKLISVLMHREIMGLTPGSKNRVDHRDFNGLNNTRQNLRIATPSQNSRNRRPCGSSKYLGVSSKSGKWQANISYLGKTRYLGIFGDEREAAETYDFFARELHGEFANLNFPIRHVMPDQESNPCDPIESKDIAKVDL